MVPLLLNYDSENRFHTIKIEPQRSDVIFSLEITNYIDTRNFDDLLVRIWPENKLKDVYEFNFTDMVQDDDKPGKSIFIFPLDRNNMEPPFKIGLFSEEDLVDMKDWKVFVSWS